METTLQQRGSMALRLGPNLRAIVSKWNSGIDQKLSSLFMIQCHAKLAYSKKENKLDWLQNDKIAQKIQQPI